MASEMFAETRGFEQPIHELGSSRNGIGLRGLLELGERFRRRRKAS
ncbi:MAG: hypothetical protein QOF48_2459, partial [Verrucomicrobiota bacterium]